MWLLKIFDFGYLSKIQVWRLDCYDPKPYNTFSICYFLFQIFLWETVRFRLHTSIPSVITLQEAQTVQGTSKHFWNSMGFIENMFVHFQWCRNTDTIEFSLNVFTEFSDKIFVITVKWLEPATTTVPARHVPDRIFKLIPIHASVIYQIHWIQWIPVPFRKNFIISMRFAVLEDAIHLKIIPDLALHQEFNTCLINICNSWWCSSVPCRNAKNVHRIRR